MITRTLGGGEIAFLPGHAPFLGGAHREPHPDLRSTDGTVLDVAVHGGFVEVSNNTVSILSDVAELGHHVDRARAQRGQVARRGRAAAGREDDAAEAESQGRAGPGQRPPAAPAAASRRAAPAT